VIRDMVRVTAANPNLITDPTHRTDPNGGGDIFGFTNVMLMI